MGRVFVTADGQVRLDELREPVEVSTPDGHTLGYFYPAGNGARQSPHSIEELEQLRKVRTGRTLAEIREDLNERGIPL
jgi:hypothetical protein